MDILVIRFSSLGDVIMATAVIEALHQRFPDYHLYFLTKREYAPVFEHDMRIKKVVGIGRKENPLEIISLLDRKYFDTVIDLHSTLRSIAITMLVKSPLKLRVKKHAIERRIMVWSRNRFKRSFDMLGNYIEMMKPLGVTGRVFPLIMPARKAAAAADEILKKKGVSVNHMIGIAPGAKHPKKRWNKESFARVADGIAGRGYAPIFLGDENDIEFIDHVRKIMKEHSVTLAGETELSVTIALVSRLSALVTNDSGLMHVAGALGIPFVAVFGPTHPNLGFAPGYPSGVIMHSGADCSPCSIHGQSPCRKRKRPCMDEITWEMVMGKVDTVINKDGL